MLLREPSDSCSYSPRYHLHCLVELGVDYIGVAAVDPEFLSYPKDVLANFCMMINFALTAADRLV